MTPTLSVRNLSTGYGKKQVLFDVSLKVMPGEIVLVVGGNGSGKSTLLKTVYGLLLPWNANAEIIFQPEPHVEPLGITPPHENLRRGLAYLPQKNSVFDDLSVEENLRVSGDSLPDAKAFPQRREEVLRIFPVLRPLLRRKLQKMSGGERQMLALGIALLHRPKLLLLDEPTAGLSENLAVEIFQLISRLRQEHGFSVLMVEHRTRLADVVAERIISLQLGRIDSRTEQNQQTRITI